MSLSAAELAAMIMQADDLGIETVTIPEWKTADGKPMVVGIRTLTVGDRDSFEAEMLRAKESGYASMENFRAKYLVRCLCHPESGDLLFTDPADLAKKSSKVVSRLFDKATKRNAMSQEDVDELAKN
jgi:hypothetical protein